MLPSAFATEVILSFIQIPVTVSDTLQTRKSFYYSFRIQGQDTVRIHSRHESHSVTHTDLNPSYSFRYTPDTEVILLLIQFSTSDTIQIHSRHDSHSDIHSTFKHSYNSDTPQTLTPFFCSYKNQSPDTVQLHSRHEYHFDANSSDLQHYNSTKILGWHI